MVVLETLLHLLEEEGEGEAEALLETMPALLQRALVETAGMVQLLQYRVLQLTIPVEEAVDLVLLAQQAMVG
jgi:hypothetical protein